MVWLLLLPFRFCLANTGPFSDSKFVTESRKVCHNHQGYVAISVRSLFTYCIVPAVRCHHRSSVSCSFIGISCFHLSCGRYLTALKLLCSLLQRPEGSLAQVYSALAVLFSCPQLISFFCSHHSVRHQVFCDHDLCSKIVDAAKEAENEEM